MPPIKYQTLLAATTTTTAQPTDGAAPTQGILIPPGVDRADLKVFSTAGSGTMECTIRLWGWEPASDKWLPMSTGAGAGDTVNKSGLLNGGVKYEEIGTDKIRGYETVVNLSLFERLYAQVVQIAGTDTAIQVDLSWHRAENW